VPASGPYIGTPTAVFDSLRYGLADLGYVEGQNIRYEYRSAPDRAGLGEMAAELVRLKVDVLVAAGAAAFIAKPVSASTPVVFGFSGDPVQARLVGGVARPGAT
jgi:putative ABC transport system substrate-binding protein